MAPALARFSQGPYQWQSIWQSWGREQHFVLGFPWTLSESESSKKNSKLWWGGGSIWGLSGNLITSFSEKEMLWQMTAWQCQGQHCHGQRPCGKRREVQRQILEAIQSKNIWLQLILLWRQQAIQYCKPAPGYVMQPLENKGSWEQLLLTGVLMKHYSQKPFPSQTPDQGTENSDSPDPNSSESSITPANSASALCARSSRNQMKESQDADLPVT